MTKEFAELAVHTLMHEHAALEHLPTPARRAELTGMVDSVLVITLRFFITPTNADAVMLRKLYQAMLGYFHNILGGAGTNSGPGLRLQHALLMVTPTMLTEERASVASMRQSFKAAPL